MLVKLSLTGVKSRLRDYLVLFSGLVMAAAIFYMFQSMASNEAFLKSNSLVSSIVFIFYFGTVLLSIITLVYIFYANSFLMAMRQKDYGMFMMLGAKSKKIAQMIFIETFLIGILATICGSIVGLGLTSVVNHLLTTKLNIQIQHFSPLNGKAFLVTVVFFTILFLIAAVSNATVIAKKPILTLLRENQTPLQVKRRKSGLFFEAVLGVILLIAGYVMMDQLMVLQLLGIAGALVTIVLGTYFIFHSVIVFILSMLKKVDNIAFKKLNNFTLSQLSFRMQEYTRILSMVAMLVALALGALTVGLGFRNEIPKMANAVTPYDLVLNNAQKVDQQKVSALNPTTDVNYQFKEDAENIYYLTEEFNQTPISTHEFKQDRSVKVKKYTGSEMQNNITAQDAIRSVELPDQQSKEMHLVSQAEFDAIDQSIDELQLVQVNDFLKQLKPIQALAHENEKNNPSIDEDGIGSFSQKVSAYNSYNIMFSGFEFMGFFLGLAFLTMLASCLMFKILSGAYSDVQRYRMLNKIGARQSLLKQSIRREIGVLFLGPGFLGMVHVLFGLKMFTAFLSDPYQALWIPFGIFFLLYLIYYVITVWMYTHLVIEQQE
ncbi:ABC transporter permease [Candidatus Enterococcus ferrettii]|uniref:ABC3 transporter permease C-terminal domain-containing protein n=1 Tax=Candidatus Enterococcus ferrettii TaxID=2815324 RepID=A0ABV0EV65_9ENTE|nr:ABC transporter permease [Enterococcus sp. 665A]MBO1340370.1 ABC transporter permease [Enterococcus sp. 665A]